MNGKECCTYIPNNSEEIHDVAEEIRRVAARYDYNKGWDLGSWLKEMFGGWGAWILHILFIGLMIFVAIVIVACMKVIIGACVRKFYSYNNGGA